MHTLDQRTSAAFVAFLLIVSMCFVMPVTGAILPDRLAQQGGTDPLYANATRVDVDDPINGEIGANDTADVYAIDLSDGTQLEIGQGIGGGGAPVTLVDRNGTVLDRIPDQSVLTAADAFIRANASYSGTYYLKIDGEAGEEYSIGLGATEPDANEPNDDAEAATEVAIGDARQGTLVRGDADFYAVDLDAGRTIGVLTNGSVAGEVAILDADGEVVERATVPAPGGQRESEQGLTPVVNATADSGSTYTIVFSIPTNVSGNVNGEYAFAVVDRGEDLRTPVENSSTTDTGTPARTDRTRIDADEPETNRTDTTAADTDGTTRETTTNDTTEAGTDETATDRPENPGTTTEDATAEETTSVVTGDNDGDADPDDVLTAADGPGFGTVGAIVALLGVALLATRRR